MGQLSSSRRGGGSILPPQHLCMWVGVHRETVMMTIDVNVTWATCRLVAPYPPRSHAVPIVSLLTLAGDRFPFSCMCYYPRDGCDNSREVDPPSSLSPTPLPAAIRAPPLSATRCGGDRDSRDAEPATAWRGGRLALRATSLLLTTESELGWRRSSPPTPLYHRLQLATPDASPPLPPFMPLECPY